MTVQVGRNDIKLGWEAGAAIILFLISTMFGAGMFFSNYMAKQDKLYSMVEQLVRRDSIKTEQYTIISEKVSTQGRKIDSVIGSTPQTAFYERKKKHYYIERKVNGKLQFIEVDNPNEVN